MVDLKKQLASTEDVVRQLRLGRADLEEALLHQKTAAEEASPHTFQGVVHHFHEVFPTLFIILERDIHGHWLGFCMFSSGRKVDMT